MNLFQPCKAAFFYTVVEAILQAAMSYMMMSALYFRLVLTSIRTVFHLMAA